MKNMSFDQALAFVCDHKNKAKSEYKDVMAYVFENAPPELREKLDEARRKFFPELVPDHVDEEGNRYFSLESVRKTFGMSKEDIDLVIKEMRDHDRRMGLKPMIMTVDSRKLIPVQ